MKLSPSFTLAWVTSVLAVAAPPSLRSPQKDPIAPNVRILPPPDEDPDDPPPPPPPPPPPSPNAVRKTGWTMAMEHTPGATNIPGAIDNAIQVGEALRAVGWTWQNYNQDGDIIPGHIMNTAAWGADFVFFCGHGTPSGPFLGADKAAQMSLTQFNWSSFYPDKRGVRWYMGQSCEWLKNGVGQVKPFTFVQQNDSDPLNLYRWHQAMGDGRGSMHAIFAFAAVSYAENRGTSWVGGLFGHEEKWSVMDLAGVRWVHSVLGGGGQAGPTWFDCVNIQRQALLTHAPRTSDPGEAPAVLSIQNSRGDYFYESITNPWPDPIDVADPQSQLVFHYVIYGNPEFSDNNTWR